MTAKNKKTTFGIVAILLVATYLLKGKLPFLNK